MFLTEYDEDVVHKAFYNVGFEEGEARGEARGMAEANRKTARAMLADGMPEETVAKYSSLHIEEVRKLKMV